MSELIEQVARRWGWEPDERDDRDEAEMKCGHNQHLVSALRELSAKLDTRWEDWRKQLLDAWAKDHRATMTALLEGGPAATPETTNERGASHK